MLIKRIQKTERLAAKAWLVNAAIIAALCLSGCSTAINGRAVYDGSALASMNHDAAIQAGKALVHPQVVITDEWQGGAYGFAATYQGGLIKLHPGVKNFHVYHELAHVYQRGLDTCEAREMDAMLKTSAWCQSHNCPVHDVEYMKGALKC